jgi:hypothetical protein
VTADRIARLIGAGFGAVYVLVNADALGSPLDVVLRVAAGLSVVALLAGATPDAVTVLAGVLPGVLLLGGAWWGVAPRPAVAAAR